MTHQKRILSIAMGIAMLLGYETHAQTWNTAGNAGTNPANDFVGTTDAKALRIRTNNQVRMSIGQTGNVGIATQTPTDRLHVNNGHLRVESNFANDSSILMLNQATSNCHMQYRVGNVPRAYTGYDVSTNTFFTSASATGTRPDFSIKATNGFVGMGNNGAIYPLHVTGTSTVGIQYDGTTAGYAGAYMNATDTGAGKPFYGYKINGAIKGWTYMDKNGKFNIYNSGDRITVQSDGNVGIGTSSPSYRLHVVTSNDLRGGYFENATASASSTYAVYGSATNSGTGGAYAVHGNAMGAGGLNLGVYGSASGGDNNYGVYGYASGTNAFGGYFVGRGYFSDDVGIGTGSPEYRLHVTGGSDAALASGGYIVTGITASENIAIDNNEIMARNNGAASTLYLNHSGGNIAMCNAGGNVTIGTTVPATGYLLSVDGKIMAEEIRVELSGNWPDYVFKPDYKLMSIEEVANTIATEGHLPNMPSAKDVEEQGSYHVGEMQTRLLEKVEELTLYIIQLKKENDELKARMNAIGK